MTGYTVHTGSTAKFSSGWDLIFQGTQPKSKAPASVSDAKQTKKKISVKSIEKKVAKKATTVKSGSASAKKSAAKVAKKGK